MHTIRNGEIVNYALPANNFLRLWNQLLTPQISLFKRSWLTYLGSWTEKLLEPSFNPDSLHLLVSKELTYDSYIKNNRVTDFDALISVQHGASTRFADWNIWVNMKSGKNYSYLQLKDLSEIDKGDQIFLAYLQSLSNLRSPFCTGGSRANGAIEEYLLGELKQLYEPYLYPVLAQAVKNYYPDTWIIWTRG